MALTGNLTGSLSASMSAEGGVNGLINFDGSGTDNYNELDNKPSINGVVLEGNKTSSDLHIESGGTDNYNDLLNKPKINGTTLTGDVSDTQLHIDYNHLINKPVIPDISEIETRLDTAETDIDNLQSDMTSAESSITSQGALISSIEDDITDINSDITGLDTRVGAAEGDIDTLQGDMTQAQSDISELNSSFTNYKSRTVQSKVAYNKSTTSTWYETNITPDTIQGYTAVGIAGYAFNVSNGIVYQLYWTGSSAHIGISRTSSNLSDVVFTLYFEYVKN